MSRVLLLAVLATVACNMNSDEDDPSTDSDTPSESVTSTDTVDTTITLPSDTLLIPTDVETAPVPTDSDTETDIDTDLPTCGTPGWVRDCNLICFPSAVIGRGDSCEEGPAPQADFNCARFEWDGGDCERETDTLVESEPLCGLGEVEDCNGNCFIAILVGDGICQDGPAPGPDFNCAVHDFDEDDCAPPSDTEIMESESDSDVIGGLCPDPYDVTDCNGICYATNWLGDGMCDEGQSQPWGSPDFNCAFHGYDDADCPIPASDTDN